MTYDNPRLEMIRQVYHERAAQHFRVEVTRDEAKQAAHIIGEYNEFNPQKFGGFVESLPEDAMLRMGRDFSPAVYVSTLDLWGEELLSKMVELSEAADLRAENVYLEGQFWCCIWWD